MKYINILYLYTLEK